ncbi:MULTISPECIES: hypothetical protein [unclassified Bradyrhizobium]|uniref:hypothetical protein n=1 Tax=unclassified Bradyrhizobium TaxID=2631580 RepID=UPI001CD1DC07|nr:MULTISPECIES: hypothetical protein [unclassified Bradyrhizobium]MCA1386484.1 hypothetical protein [Bradyrhizobium sp. BRP05]MCA1394595.1 hypothetical protein [Bradyrhizobium sp. IC3123]MCA1431275.1 hypothetical protein [Bradyrhizobium sp. NBAIM16]MCA1480698.1 hypothetical protein [Bradyrhizobium sp. NBAIM08]MCA1509294.1 hypothetical protein [Bradyrhizobium sp. NBAIM02]
MMQSILLAFPSGRYAAATAAAKEAGERRDQMRDALSRNVEAACYGADRALQQFDAAAPASRLVARNARHRTADGCR